MVQRLGTRPTALYVKDFVTDEEHTLSNLSATVEETAPDLPGNNAWSEHRSGQ